MEEYKDFCSGGHVCARNVPGVNLGCPELRDFGPFAKQEQPPTEPHGSGVQGWGSGTEVSPRPMVRELPVRTGRTGSSVQAGSVCLVPPKRSGVLHPQDQAGQRHGEWLLGVTDICLRQTLKKKKQNPNQLVFKFSQFCSSRTTYQPGPASAAL